MTECTDKKAEAARIRKQAHADLEAANRADRMTDSVKREIANARAMLARADALDPPPEQPRPMAKPKQSKHLPYKEAFDLAKHMIAMDFDKRYRENYLMAHPEERKHARYSRYC